jgi:hypothetical protein
MAFNGTTLALALAGLRKNGDKRERESYKKSKRLAKKRKTTQVQT